jgi:hypothetical protein
MACCALVWTGRASALDGRCVSHSLWEALLRSLPLALYGGVLGALAGSIVWALLTLAVRLIRRRSWRRLPPRWGLVALLCGLVCFLLSEAFGSALAMACF